MSSEAPLQRIGRALSEATAATHRSGWSLPREAYNDPAMLALELDMLFGQEWVCIGRTDEVPEPGDTLPIVLHDRPLLAVRGDDRVLRVLSNVCRHRGAVLVDEPGQRPLLRCPYHHWTYQLDGTLAAAPRLDEHPFDRSACSLPGVAVEEWMGFMFVSLADSPRPLAPQLAGLEALIAPYHLEEMRTRFVVEEIWPTNWKCFVENFMEGYHLTPLHRTTLHPVNPTRLCRHFPAGDAYFGYHAGFTAGLERVEQGHPDLTPAQVDDCVMFAVPPGLVSGCAADYSSFVCVQPLGVDQVKLKLGLMFFGDRWSDAQVEHAGQLFQETNAEDRVVLAGVTAGLRSPQHAPGPLAPADFEGTVLDLQRYLARRIGPALSAAAATDAPR